MMFLWSMIALVTAWLIKAGVALFIWNSAIVDMWPNLPTANFKQAYLVVVFLHILLPFTGWPNPKDD